MKSAKTASKIGIALNSFLFVLKITAGLISGSLAVISDALNSFTDILSSSAIFLSIKISSKKADKGHPFGHSRSEPIAALIVAVLAAVLGLEIIYEAVKRIIANEIHSFGVIPFAALIITIAVKTVMMLYFRRVNKETRSPAIKALLIDSKNDIAASAIAAAGLAGSRLAHPISDSLAALIVSAYVIMQGAKLAKENIRYLIGASPSDVFIINVKRKVMRIKGVEGINTIKAHYVGNKINIEIHIEVNQAKNVREAHDIGKKVQLEIEKMNAVNRAFVHIDPA